MHAQLLVSSRQSIHLEGNSRSAEGHVADTWRRPGVAAFAAFSDGRRIAPLNALGKIRDKPAKLHPRLARKVKRSAIG